MKKELHILFLCLLGFIVLSGCADNSPDLIEDNKGAEITANVYSVFSDAFTSKASYDVDKPTPTAPLKARILASKTSGKYAGDNLYANGTMTFMGPSKTAFDEEDFWGNNRYVGNDLLYFIGLYPDTDWEFVGETQLTRTFTGKEDVMLALETESSLPLSANNPSFDFKHLLTKLSFKFVAENQGIKNAWGKITDLELIGAHNTVTLLAGASDLALAAPVPSAYTGNTDLSVHLIADDTPLKEHATGVDIQLTSATTTPLAYVLAAPVIASSEAGEYEYTLRLKTAAGYEQTIPLNLKSLEDIPFSGNTQGCSFEVTLTFKADEIVEFNVLTLDNWLTSILIQPVPLGQKEYVNMARIHSALASFGYLNEMVGNQLMDSCKYFAVYMKNDITHDIVINMDAYDGSFTEKEQVIFDVKKIVGTWKVDTLTSENYLFTVDFNPEAWALVKSAQPIDPPVDGKTYATTLTPSNTIQNKGSIILERK